MEELLKKSILVLGYGREGRSFHRYLRRFDRAKCLGIADLNPVVDPLDQNIHVHSGEDYLKAIQDYEVIIRSPGISLLIPELQQAIAAGKMVTSCTNIFLQSCPGKLIGITGTKGKSTTSSLIYQMLRSHFDEVQLVGNIGEPMLDYLPQAGPATLSILELSSYQLLDVTHSPAIGILLAIVPEHLDYHGSFAAYQEAKFNLLRYQSPEDLAIGNPNYESVAQGLALSPGHKKLFSPQPDQDYCCTIDQNQVVNDRGETIIALDDIPLLGPGNLENILAACSVALALDVPIPTINQAIATFKNLDHRLQYVGKFREIDFYNDSIATIPEATINGLQAFGGRVATLIVGGYDRGVGFEPLAQYLIEHPVKNLILFPTTGSKIWAAIERASHGQSIPIKAFPIQTMAEAIAIAYDQTPKDHICLLSPASTSFNQYKNFQERGQDFTKWVELLGQPE